MIKIFEYLRINNHVIELKMSKEPTFDQIYSLKLIK